MSKYSIDTIGTRTVIDGNVIAHLHVDGKLYVHGTGPLKPEDLQWLMLNQLSAAFKKGAAAPCSHYNPYEDKQKHG